jgi:alkylhydroperoxidase/carboxymuconolactone decarboxylase family protein YurZ
MASGCSRMNARGSARVIVFLVRSYSLHALAKGSNLPKSRSPLIIRQGGRVMPENPLGTAIKIDPQVVDHMRSTDDWAFSDGALSKKVKLLVAMAFDAAHGAVGGVRGLAQRAMKEGATKEEISEVLRVAYVMTGVGAIYIGSQGLKELFP